MLVFLSLLYLALPYFLFAWGWLWWPYAILVWLVLSVALARVAVQVGRRPAVALDDTPQPGLNWGGILAVTVGLLLVSGIGGLGAQNEDWLKHNAVLHDLATSEWPVIYQQAPPGLSGQYLTYYVAYYLPAALVGRVAGLTAAHLALSAWTFLGLLLTATWLQRLLRSRLWIFWAGWFLLSGMDAVGVLMRRGDSDYVFLEWWATLGQYSSNVTLLLWVPQHALPGWIATALILDETEREGNLAWTGLAAALTGLWSPFVTIGLVPLAVVLAARAKWRTAVSFANLVAAPLLLGIAVAYLTTVRRDDIPNQWNLLRYETSWFLRVYVAVVVLEFGAVAALAWWHLRRSRSDALPGAGWNGTWLLVAVICLSLLPWYQVGICNDLMMRASIPSLVLLWVVVLRALASPAFRIQTWASSLLAFCLLLGAIQPLYQIGAQVDKTRLGLKLSGDRAVTIFDVPDQYWSQYLGYPETFFFRHLAPPPASR